jgi:hypothetical protein
MKLKLNFFVPTATHPNLEEVCVTNPEMLEPTPTTVYEWAHTVLAGRRFEYPLAIAIRVDGRRWVVPLWLMKYQHEVADTTDTFYVLKPFLPFTPVDHALIEDDWTDSKGEHSIRTDYSMDNAGVLYTGEHPTRYSFTLIHKEIKGTLFRK